MEKSKAFVVPFGKLEILFFVAPFFKASCMSAGDAAVLIDLYKAATPVTCGVAIDVPDIVVVEVVVAFDDEVRPLPGAKISTTVP